MAISIRNQKAENLARELSGLTGVSMTQIIIDALEEKLERTKGSKRSINLLEEIQEIAQRCQSLPDIDTRTHDEILNYNQSGVDFGY
ncbi:MAG: type II toxin-antitoxin system VapB family antitoxin [SAR324 cluster bacterium]|nr:type II toxin-antitoxin system VapB family antitoxin [SAR324 cluster bacterium]